MSVKRIRVFAGPNGSGKTTIFKGILERENISLGVYVNADEIELQLNEYRYLDFSHYSISPPKELIQTHFRNSKFSPVKRNEPELYKSLDVDEHKLFVNTTIDSYIAADIAEFIRQYLVLEGTSLTFETVMSHSDKIAFLRTAKTKGYRVYLYYIATEDPEININRVDVRVAQHGHAVEQETIRNRYFKSLGLLKSAVTESDRAYIFDNSGEQAALIAEITDGKAVKRNEATSIPAWVEQYLFN